MSDETKEKMRKAKLLNPTRFWLGKGRPGLNKDRIFSEDHKNKLRQAKLANPCRYWLGKTRKNVHSEEYKRQLSEKMKRSSPFHGKNMSGANNPRWITDRSQIKIGDRNLHDPLQKGWRKAVKDRDGWTCRIADNNCAGRLEAHHILPWKEFPELRYEINNGITLCHSHHPRKKDDVMKLSPYFNKLVASLD